MRQILFFIDTEKNRKLVDNESKEIFDFVIIAPEDEIPPESKQEFSQDPPHKAWFIEILAGCSESGWRLAYSPGSDSFWLVPPDSGKAISVSNSVMIIRNVITEKIQVMTPPLSELIGHDKKYSTRNLETVFIGA